jgi:5-methylcytosine-specific restriction endonuclease McrA
MTLMHEGTTLERPKGTPCYYCGRTLSKGGRSEVKLTWDHVVPRSRGGITIRANMVPACQDCNSRKGSLLLDEFRMFKTLAYLATHPLQVRIVRLKFAGERSTYPRHLTNLANNGKVEM